MDSHGKQQQNEVRTINNELFRNFLKQNSHSHRFSSWMLRWFLSPDFECVLKSHLSQWKSFTPLCKSICLLNKVLFLYLEDKQICFDIRWVKLVIFGKTVLKKWGNFSSVLYFLPQMSHANGRIWSSILRCVCVCAFNSPFVLNALPHTSHMNVLLSFGGPVGEIDELWKESFYRNHRKIDIIGIFTKKKL